ncbi:quinoprotein glucose dehydrogenase [Robiginitalea myxolifaciens]|uniref:Quinoprotein glucose dehydrogenase n=1 Tax=Robiginitalea myxolifaciens TaxID=400055 RepID=A0A1I6G3G5_9FLAO|nr:pyrroloquinoline quinone-dependent dehydrogenase [Robiginitalea myxolifaciens]SFR36719.1 quinoprotein glucose dehydrogenase [Robiginitalea myxolifaciens]
MKSYFLKPLVLCILSGVLLLSCADTTDSESVAEAPAAYYTDWSHYLGDPGRSHFSTLNEFTRENIAELKPVWSFESPDWGQMQMNPLVVDTLLFGVSAAMRPFALDARSGELQWIHGDTLRAWYATSRGVSYWSDGSDRRIFFTRGEQLIALDALTGTPIPTFGENGQVDLRSGLPSWARDRFVSSTTPGTIFKDLIVMPLRVGEGAGAAPGNILAFDVRTGEVKWRFNTLPEPGGPGSETWEDQDALQGSVVGGANNWAGMALDAQREILYVPTGSAAPDFYGGVRLGQNLFANTLLALDANTGERLWHFQFTHHDIWDRDPPAPPNLLTVVRDGKEIPAVAQVTKQGFIFLFDRRDGTPLFEIEEVPVPPSKLPGESAWTTQPKPVKPEPFARQAQDLTENDISPYAPNQEELLHQFQNADRRWYAPPSTEPVFLLPGYDGAAEWGGAAADPNRGILYVNSNEMAWFLQLDETEDVSELSPGEQLYRVHCAICHQPDRSGVPESGYPDLRALGERMNQEGLETLIVGGKGMMPGFPHIDSLSRIALGEFLLETESKGAESAEKQEVVDAGPNLNAQVPYQHRGYHKFLDANGLPGINPPWGTLHAVDMNSGEYLWQIPLGDTESLKAEGQPPTGTENYGGPVITENGLLFIAATKDGYFRVFDRDSGALLWEYKLPAPAFATPALYTSGGKQFIVLACGGEKLGTPKGNTILAFGLE